MTFIMTIIVSAMASFAFFRSLSNMGRIAELERRVKEMENKDTLVVPKTISIKPKLIIRSSTLRNG